MKKFFKSVLAACLGFFAAISLIFLFFMLLGGAMGAGKISIEKKSVLKLDFSNPIPEMSDNVKSGKFDFDRKKSIGLSRIVKLINHAAKDNSIKGILINTSGVSAGQATIATIREALIEFKQSDKFIYAYSNTYSQSAYYLASVADSIYLNPNGMIDIKGFGTMIPFFKETLEKVGVKMNVFYAGNFKSATEPFRRTEMSEPNKIQTKEFLNSILSHYQESVAQSRNITVEDVNNIMTNYSGRNATTSLQSKLIDRIAYWDQMESVIKSKLDVKLKKKINYVSLGKYNGAANIKKDTKSKGKIAVIFAEGTIEYGGKDSKGNITEDKYLEILEDIAHDKNIDAVVLRVNSGGGSSLTSDLIWRGIEKVKAAGKPVIASFGDYAASGGYYISAGADTIVSAPNTLTGSIGVFMMFPNTSELLNEKLGIHFDDVRTHPMAINMVVSSELSDQEKEFLQSSVTDIYDIFLKRVADGRGMTVEAVHEVAQGRVWTGSKALELGLVDVIGGLNDAIAIAAKSAGVDKYRVKTYPEIKASFMDQMLKSLADNNEFASMRIAQSDLQLLEEYNEVKNLITDRSPQSRLPYIMKFD
ncbi:MAG: signal peptide peptidase SppA [Saprospiraceae bacterium]